jgi:FkbM family methyltransferase
MKNAPSFLSRCWSLLTKHRRLRLLYFGGFGRRWHDASRKHFFYNVLGPTCGMAARSIVVREEIQGDFRLIYFQGLDYPLFYPKDYSNQSLYGVIREMLPKSWHYYEPPETRVRPDDVVFDVGAAEGIFAFFVAPRARLVHAFEPLPAFLACMKRTFEFQDNVTVIPAAVAEKPSMAWLKGDGAASEVSVTPTDTPIVIESIDAYCARTGVIPSFLKADIEGCEPRMLEGAAETIRLYKPRMAITTYHNKGDTESIRHCLARLNPAYRFRLKGIEPKRGDPVMLHAW